MFCISSVVLTNSGKLAMGWALSERTFSASKRTLPNPLCPLAD
jgi:hypothetical protein